MRIPSTDLGDLINALTPTEKSYFKKFADKNVSGQKTYLDLFDFYNKTGINEILKKNKPYKHLSRVKNYLYEVILKSLRIYNSEVYVQTRIHELLQNAEILHEKLLFRQAMKAVEKAKVLASEYEMLNNMLDILWWERHICYRIQKSSEELQQELERINREADQTTRSLSNLQEYRKLFDELYTFIIQTGTSRDKFQKEALERYVSSPLIKNEDLALSFWAKVYVHYIRHLYADTIQDFESSYIAAARMLELLESRPKIANEHMYGLIDLLNFVIQSCIKTRRYDLLDRNLKKLRELPGHYPNASTQRARISIFEVGYIAEITRNIKTGDFDAAVELAGIIQEGIEEYKNKMHNVSKLMLYLNISKAYFGAGEYKTALLWLNRVLQNNELNLRENLLIFAKIFNLIIHFELKNDEFLPYTVKSTYRFLHKKDKLYKVETEILNFIKRYSAIRTREEHIRSFSDLKERLLPLEKDPYEKLAFEEFNYIDWLESKIQNKKLADIIREKANAVRV